MTHEELDTIEDNLRKVDKFSPGGYGIVTALELVAELRKLLPLAAVDEAQSQLDALAIRLKLRSQCGGVRVRFQVYTRILVRPTNELPLT